MLLLTLLLLFWLFLLLLLLFLLLSLASNLGNSAGFFSSFRFNQILLSKCLQSDVEKRNFCESFEPLDSNSGGLFGKISHLIIRNIKFGIFQTVFESCENEKQFKKDQLKVIWFKFKSWFLF